MDESISRKVLMASFTDTEISESFCVCSRKQELDQSLSATCWLNDAKQSKLKLVISCMPASF